MHALNLFLLTEILCPLTNISPWSFHVISEVKYLFKDPLAVSLKECLLNQVAFLLLRQVLYVLWILTIFLNTEFTVLPHSVRMSSLLCSSVLRELFRVLEFQVSNFVFADCSFRFFEHLPHFQRT